MTVDLGSSAVLWVLLAMLVILGLSGLVAAYVAFPRRGEQVPGVPWIGDVLRRSVLALPTLDNQRSGWMDLRG